MQPLQYIVAKQSTVLLCGWRQPPQPAPRYSTRMWNVFVVLRFAHFLLTSHFWLVVHIYFFNLENVYWGKRIKIKIVSFLAVVNARFKSVWNQGMSGEWEPVFTPKISQCCFVFSMSVSLEKQMSRSPWYFKKGRKKESSRETQTWQEAGREVEVGSGSTDSRPQQERLLHALFSSWFTRAQAPETVYTWVCRGR